MNSNNINVLPYEYGELLERFYHQLDKKNANISGSFFLKPPSTFSKGRKTIWANFGTICNMLNRPYEHVMAFIFSELGCTGGLDSSDPENVKLNINLKFTSKNLENVLRNYISIYIKCKACKSPDTRFSSDKKFIICNICKSEHSAPTINQGFKAMTKQTRKNNRLNIMD